MSKKVTAENLTREQIAEVFALRPDVFMMHKDDVNLHETVEPYASIRRAALDHIAEIINARNAAKAGVK